MREEPKEIPETPAQAGPAGRRMTAGRGKRSLQAIRRRKLFNRNFILLFQGQFISQVGTQIAIIGEINLGQSTPCRWPRWSA